LLSLVYLPVGRFAGCEDFRQGFFVGGTGGAPKFPTVSGTAVGAGHARVKVWPQALIAGMARSYKLCKHQLKS